MPTHMDSLFAPDRLGTVKVPVTVAKGSPSGALRTPPPRFRSKAADAVEIQQHAVLRTATNLIVDVVTRRYQLRRKLQTQEIIQSNDFERPSDFLREAGEAWWSSRRRKNMRNRRSQHDRTILIRGSYPVDKGSVEASRPSLPTKLIW